MTTISQLTIQQPLDYLSIINRINSFYNVAINLVISIMTFGDEEEGEGEGQKEWNDQTDTDDCTHRRVDWEEVADTIAEVGDYT